jgi:protein-lysine N-methyltransferase EEF2KMT
MNCWSELIAQPKPSALQAAQQLSYIRYTAPSSADDQSYRTVVTLESRGLILSSGTTGFRTWEAALHLGTFFCTAEGESILRGKRVIELGAGTGFLSMYCAKYLDVESVLVTDREQALISGIQDCVARNNVDASKIMPAIWQWGRPFDASQGSPYQQLQNFDVALGADLV